MSPRISLQRTKRTGCRFFLPARPPCLRRIFPWRRRKENGESAKEGNSLPKIIETLLNFQPSRKQRTRTSPRKRHQWSIQRPRPHLPVTSEDRQAPDETSHSSTSRSNHPTARDPFARWEHAQTEAKYVYYSTIRRCVNVFRKLICRFIQCFILIFPFIPGWILCTYISYMLIHEACSKCQLEWITLFSV